VVTELNRELELQRDDTNWKQNENVEHMPSYVSIHDLSSAYEE